LLFKDEGVTADDVAESFKAATLDNKELMRLAHEKFEESNRLQFEMIRKLKAKGEKRSKKLEEMIAEIDAIPDTDKGLVDAVREARSNSSTSSMNTTRGLIRDENNFSGANKGSKIKLPIIFGDKGRESEKPTDVTNWYQNCMFILDLQSIFNIKTRLAHLVGAIGGKYQGLVIKAIKENVSLSEDDVLRTLLKLLNYNRAYLKSEISKFRIVRDRQLVEQFLELRNLIELQDMKYSFAKAKEDTLDLLTLREFELKLPKAIASQVLFKMESEGKSPREIISLAQKILDSSQPTEAEFNNLEGEQEENDSEYLSDVNAFRKKWGKDVKSVFGNKKDKSKTPCWICDKTGHKAFDCFKKSKQGCYKCGQTSHRIKDCPERKSAGQDKKEKKAVPQGYLCKVCSVSGHWIWECPQKGSK